MKIVIRCLLCAGLAMSLISPPGYAALQKCEVAVEGANKALEAKGLPKIRDTKTLADLLRYLNDRAVLPAHFVTRDKAIKEGWSGKEQDSIRTDWTRSKTVLGGDLYTGTLPEKGPWYSADLDSERGLPSRRHLFFNPDSKGRYLSTNNNASVVALPPCD